MTKASDWSRSPQMSKTPWLSQYTHERSKQDEEETGKNSLAFNKLGIESLKVL